MMHLKCFVIYIKILSGWLVYDVVEEENYWKEKQTKEEKLNDAKMDNDEEEKIVEGGNASWPSSFLCEKPSHPVSPELNDSNQRHYCYFSSVTRSLGYLLSFDVMFIKLLVLQGSIVLDKFDKNSFSYNDVILMDATEEESKNCPKISKTSLLSIEKIISKIMVAIPRCFKFILAGFGFWDDEMMRILIQSKFHKLNPDEVLITKGYADEFIASIIRPRAALIRIFPYAAPVSLFMQQVGTVLLTKNLVKIKVVFTSVG